MPNKWVDFVKEYAKKNNISYGCALSNTDMKNEYNKIHKSIKNLDKKDIAKKKEETKQKIKEFLSKTRNELKREARSLLRGNMTKEEKKQIVILDKKIEENNKNKVYNETYTLPIFKKKSGVIL